ncbi:MAG: hypothetical protein H6849_02420 [Alphaproteobacteria bacterium]|nr:MAG: hypothetical protein H6849_02420 [Alphaproteobacteria bacterium]
MFDDGSKDPTINPQHNPVMGLAFWNLPCGKWKGFSTDSDDHRGSQ